LNVIEYHRVVRPDIPRWTSWERWWCRTACSRRSRRSTVVEQPWL